MKNKVTTIKRRLPAKSAGLLLLLFICVIWQPEVAQAQWTTSSSNPADINNTNPGNVGIGTSSPGAKLDVVGYVRASNWIDSTDATATAYLSMRGKQIGNVYGFIDPSLIVAHGTNPRPLAIGTHHYAPLALFTSGQQRFFISSEGNIGIGITTPATRLHVAGDITVDGNIAAKYQDVAEWVPSIQQLSAGTVVILDPDRTNHVLASGESYDTKVAGVVSAQPGLILGEGGAGKVKVATTGRVRVRVDATKAAIEVGNLLVTSNEPGVAMKSVPLLLGGTPIHRPGTLIGKALEPLSGGRGEILVLLSLQ